MIEPQALVGIARGWLGVPFRHQGRTRHGIDCVNAVREWIAEAGLCPPDVPRRYRPQPDGRQLRDGIEAWMLPTDVPGPGVVALIRIRREPQHVGLLTGETIIHALSRRDGRGREVGMVVETGWRGDWRMKTVALYRVPGVTYGP